MGELEGWAGEMLLQLRGYWFWILGELGERERRRESSLASSKAWRGT